MSLRLARPGVCFLALFVVAIAIAFSGINLAFAGEPQWVEVRSPNFSVVTDAGEKRGREVALRFEQMRYVFGALMTKANVNIPVPLQIVAFRNTKEMRQVAPLFHGKPIEIAGLFQQSEDRSFIMLDMSIDNPWSVVFHEYAHQLLNGNLKGEFPPWFEEGFAEYFSSIEVDGKEARVGKIPREDYEIIQQLGMMKIAELFRVQSNSATYNESGDHRTTFYAESSMLMHYIFDNKLVPKLEIYFDLVENKHVRIEDAIQQAFGMSAAQFDGALRSYVNGARYLYYPIPTAGKISSNSYTAIAMTPAAANAVLADIHLHSRDYQDRAMAEFQEILKLDPNSAAACRGLGYAYLQKQDFTNAAEYFKRASLLDASDPRVHYYNALLVARESGFGGGADAAAMTKELEKSISLDPHFADSYALLAFAQSIGGDPAHALVNIRKALEISPRNESYLFNLANIYLANRQPDQAVAVLQSLRITDNPGLAANVATTMAEARQFSARLKEAAENGDTVRIAVTPKQVSESARPAAVSPTESGPAKFLVGTLTTADCASPPSVLLTVISGTKTWKMKVADRNHLVLVGADQFSCSWSQRKVAVNYREVSDGEASVISLEMQ